MSNKNSLLEKKQENEIIVKSNENINNFSPMNSNPTSKTSIFTLSLIFLIIFILLIFAIFTIYNMFNTNIIHGIFIKGIDVSGLSPSDAKYQLDNYLNKNLPE